MFGLDLINASVLGALGCDMSVFLRYFPAAKTMYEIFVALSIGLTLLIWVWNLFKNFGLGAGSEAEDPIKLSIRSILFIFLAYYSDQIIDMALDIGGTPCDWILTSALPELNFASFNSVLLTIIGAVLGGAVTLVGLILLLILAWNYIKLLVYGGGALCAAGSYGVYRSDGICHGRISDHVQYFQKLVPDVCGAAFHADDERLVPEIVYQHGGGIYRQPALALIGDDPMKKSKRIFTILFLAALLISALCVPAFALTESEVEGAIQASGKGAVTGNVLIWFLCAIAFLKVSQKIDSLMAALGINVGRPGGSLLAEAMVAMRAVTMVVGGGRGAMAGRTGSASGSTTGKSGSAGMSGFFKGGLIGMAGRQVTNSAVKTATTQTSAVHTAQSQAYQTAATTAAAAEKASDAHINSEVHTGGTSIHTDIPSLPEHRPRMALLLPTAMYLPRRFLWKAPCLPVPCQAVCSFRMASLLPTTVCLPPRLPLRTLRPPASCLMVCRPRMAS